MVVCKFYRQGACKFGDNCKFEHPPGLGPAQPAQNSNSFSRAPHGQNRYAPLGRGNQTFTPQNQSGGPPARDNRNSRHNRDPRPYGVTRETLEEDLLRERPSWIMSGYGPGKDADIQLFGGFPLEQSPEEIRTLHYQALASGNLQQSAQMEAELAAKSNEQVQMVLNDFNGALQYLAGGVNQHPNRNDICKAGTSEVQKNGNGPFSKSTRHAQLNAQRRTQPPVAPSGFQTQPQPQGFGVSQGTHFAAQNQPSTTGFGGGSQLSGFGQQPQQPQPAAFDQSISGFGNQPAQGGFGTPPAQPNNQLFGQANVGFGQQQQPQFGQPQQPQPNGGMFAQQPMQQPNNGFNATPQMQPQSQFGAQVNQLQAPQQPVGLFGQPQVASPSAMVGTGFQAAVPPQLQPHQHQQKPQPQPNGFGSSAAPVAGATNGDVNSYTTRDTSSNKLLTWKGRPVNYVNLNGEEQPCYRRDDGSWERIWFPDGAGPAAATLENGAAGARECEYSEGIKEAYAVLKESGQFKGGIIPEVAPTKEMLSFDL